MPLRCEKISAVKGDEKYIKIVDNGLEEYNTQIVWPILSESGVIGAVIFLGKDKKIKMGETEQVLAQCAASFLGRESLTQHKF